MTGGEVASWVSAAATLAAVVAALVIAARDRRAASREAAQRWELEQLTRLAVLVAHGGIPSDAPAEVKQEEQARGAERLVLGWMLGGPERFPVALKADRLKVTSAEQIREQAADESQDPWVRGRAEVVCEAIEAAQRYRRAQ